jgi:hypothetical protein
VQKARLVQVRPRLTPGRGPRDRLVATQLALAGMGPAGRPRGGSDSGSDLAGVLRSSARPGPGDLALDTTKHGASSEDAAFPIARLGIADARRATEAHCERRRSCNTSLNPTRKGRGSGPRETRSNRKAPAGSRRVRLGLGAFRSRGPGPPCHWPAVPLTALSLRLAGHLRRCHYCH